MGGLMVRFFPLAVEDLSCPDLTELPRSPRARLRPPTEAAESKNDIEYFLSKQLKNGQPFSQKCSIFRHFNEEKLHEVDTSSD